MKEHLEVSTSKYEDPGEYESFADNYLFFPISDLIVTPLRKIGLTPNNVTILSTLISLSSIYFLSINKIDYACGAYLVGYLLDCVDGNMARKYNMGSKLGMALDMVSDQFSSLVIFIYILYTKGFNNWYIPAILLTVYLCSISFPITEALSCYKKNGTDNFYKIREDEMQGENGLIFKLYLATYKGIYNNYKLYYPTYDEEKLLKNLKIFKNFGPGNTTIFLTMLLYNLYSGQSWKIIN
jgi:hypothetical protein